MGSEKINKVIILLRILLVILLLTVASFSLRFRFGDCDKCSFIYEGEDLSPMEFSSLYSKECLKPKKDLSLNNITFQNLTIFPEK